MRLFILSFMLLFQMQGFALQVKAPSAYIRELPSVEALIVASVYVNDSLVAIGRNIDGNWLQVTRLGQPIGWISRNVVNFTFDPVLLPLTDTTTGLIGETSIVDTGFSVQTLGDVILYAEPERNAAQRAVVPVFSVVPVLERTPDNQWLYVNYLGTVGWIQQFSTYSTTPLNSIPVSTTYGDDPRFPTVVTIPPEVQLAQIDRLLGYMTPLNTLANGVASYWRGIGNGKILECQPLDANVVYYTISEQDLVELPELRQQEYPLREAVESLNAALLPTQECGILFGVGIGDAYADALNARSIFTLIIRRMESLRERIDLS